MGIAKQKSELSPLAAIGLRIKNARVQRGMSVSEMSERTKVSSRYIEHIEAGQFEELPGRSYVVGFTRSICGVLGLDEAGVIQTLKHEMYDVHQSVWVANVDERNRSVWSRLVEMVRSTF